MIAAVLPGECVATGATGDFLQGSGTYLRDGAGARRRRRRDDDDDDDDFDMAPRPGHRELVSCTSGEVVRTNKLVSVRHCCPTACQ